MKKVIVSIVFVCFVLAREASGGCLSKLFGDDSYADFNGFNKWLVRTLPEADDLQSNLAHVKSNLDKLTNPKVKRAAEIFVELHETDKCNDQVLMHFHEMKRQGLNLNGLKRIESSLRPTVGRFNELCGKFIEAKVEELYQTSLADKIGQFLKAVLMRANKWIQPMKSNYNPKPTNEFLFYISERTEKRLDPNDWSWTQTLNQLAEADPNHVKVHDRKTSELDGTSKPFFYADRFKQACNKYLLEPCDTLNGALGDTFTGMYALSELQRLADWDNHRSVAMDRTRIVQHLLYAFKVCKVWRAVDSHRLKKISKDINF